MQAKNMLNTTAK